MFGDSSAGLHKHANSVSWDCAVVCEIGKEGRDVALGEDDRCAGEAFAATWVERLTHNGHEVTPGDRANFAHAGAMLSAFFREGAGYSAVPPECLGLRETP